MLAETEESSNLGGTLGTETLGVDHIGEARDVAFALLDDRQSEDGKILTNDTTTDGLALAFTGSAGSIAGMAVGEEELDTGRDHLY